jgi:fatty-acyl-CoA synthase
VICTSDYLPVIAGFRSKTPDLAHVVVMDDATGAPETSGLTTVADISAQWLLAADSADRAAALEGQVDQLDVAFILYTSGTTGNPKGAQLTHRNIIKNAKATAEVLECTPDDIYLIPVPFSHCFGCVLGITLATLTGSTMVPLKDQTPSVAMRTVMDERITVAHGTPTHFMRYIREVEDNAAAYDTTSLRTGIIAGAPCPPETLKGIINVLKMRDIVIGYGLTEASPIVTLTRPTDSFEHRINSVGRPIPDIEVRIVDPDNEVLGVEEVGELVTRGYHVMKGYYREPEQTKVAIDADGWLHTGDLATVDAEGYYKIVGRAKDMIIYGGFNVYPKAIENELLEHPAIQEVAVVGIPDQEYGELVACVAKVDEGFTEQELVDFLYGRVSDPAVPRFVRFDVEIPLSGRGKVQKFKLRQTLTEMAKAGTLGTKIVPTAIQKKRQAQN